MLLMGLLTDKQLVGLGESPREIYNPGYNTSVSEKTEEKISNNEEKRIYNSWKEPKVSRATPYSSRNSLEVLRLSSGAAKEEGLSTDLEIIKDLESSI